MADQGFSTDKLALITVISLDTSGPEIYERERGTYLERVLAHFVALNTHLHPCLTKRNERAEWGLSKPPHHERPVIEAGEEKSSSHTFSTR